MKIKYTVKLFPFLFYSTITIILYINVFILSTTANGKAASSNSLSLDADDVKTIHRVCPAVLFCGYYYSRLISKCTPAKLSSCGQCMKGKEEDPDDSAQCIERQKRHYEGFDGVPGKFKQSVKHVKKSESAVFDVKHEKTAASEIRDFDAVPVGGVAIAKKSNEENHIGILTQTQFIIIISLAICIVILFIFIIVILQYLTYNKSKGSKKSDKKKQAKADAKMNKSAELFHYHQQKKQMTSMSSTNGSRIGIVSQNESEQDSADERDDTIYECAGLANTGELEVRNPMFREPNQMASTNGPH